MKRLITGALAALTLVGGTAGLGAAAQAQPYDHGRYDQSQSRDDRGRHDRGSSWNDRGRNGYGYGAHQRWSRGQYLPSNYRSHDRYVDYRRYHLRQPPRGYGWVRGDNGDYLMIALASGLIASIAASQY